MDKFEKKCEHELLPIKSRNEMLFEMAALGIVPSLPFEVSLLEREFEVCVAEQDTNGALLALAMQDSSETWHDNAAADIINASSVGLSTKARAIVKCLRETVIVEYPEIDNNEATLGSLIYVDFGSGIYEPILITGITSHLPAIYADRLPNDCEVVTIRSPLGSALLGAKTGDQISYDVGERKLCVVVTSVSQLNLSDPDD